MLRALRFSGNPIDHEPVRSGDAVQAAGTHERRVDVRMARHRPHLMPGSGWSQASRSEFPSSLPEDQQIQVEKFRHSRQRAGTMGPPCFDLASLCRCWYGQGARRSRMPSDQDRAKRQAEELALQQSLKMRHGSLREGAVSVRRKCSTRYFGDKERTHRACENSRRADRRS